MYCFKVACHWLDLYYIYYPYLVRSTLFLNVHLGSKLMYTTSFLDSSKSPAATG